MPRQDWEYDIVHEGEDKILNISVEGYGRVPSIEDDAVTMSETVKILVKVRDCTKIVFSQQRDYEYNFDQTFMLLQIAQVFADFSKNKELVYFHLDQADPRARSYCAQKLDFVQKIIHVFLKQDPIGSYVSIVRHVREEKLRQSNLPDVLKKCSVAVVKTLEFMEKRLEETTMIQAVQKDLAGFHIGDRGLYRKLFQPTIKPNFMYTKLMTQFPEDGEILASYMVGDTEVNIFKMPNSVQYLYHIIPPEFRLSEQEYELLDTARNIMAEHKPTKAEFIDPERMREVFSTVGMDLLYELAQHRNVGVSEDKIKELSKILLRYTVGFGLIEVLVDDEKIQDININSPMGRIPIFIVHSEFDDCYTNIIPTVREAESWATKLRLISGRPLDEANAILDTELTLPGARTRVSAIGAPLDPTGLCFSYRRHRNKPWTLPLFMKARMINSLAAGLLSFLVDGTKTMLIAGTRSSGKSSFLSSIMVEIMRRYRMITVEDTLELPVDALRQLQFNIQSLKVMSALAGEKEGVSATDGIRSTLRMGDSALIIGEVRSTEAVALYEAMRVGAAANVVAGTIHADSPYGVFDRVVNDIGVPLTSFKATDCVVIAKPLRSPDGLHRYRRVLSITEVRKDWETDPLREHGFVDLMRYNSKTDELEPTPELINGDIDIIKDIAGTVKEWAGDWDAVWSNILLRAKIKQTIVDYAAKTNNPNLLEADFVVLANDQFHLLSDKCIKETGGLDSKRIYADWERWLKVMIKKNN